jgi:hypothetical protein
MVKTGRSEPLEQDCKSASNPRIRACCEGQQTKVAWVATSGKAEGVSCPPVSSGVEQRFCMHSSLDNPSDSGSAKIRLSTLNTRVLLELTARQHFLKLRRPRLTTGVGVGVQVRRLITTSLQVGCRRMRWGDMKE